MTKVGIILLWLFSAYAGAQQLENFYYLEAETKSLPVYIRGNLDAKIILLFIQGAYADNGIDFGRSDYPNWANSLEKEVAVAYFDQRGLNRRLKDIDTSKISESQNLEGILEIAKSLRQKYGARLFLLGHSYGGKKALRGLALYPSRADIIAGVIALNTPITSDFSPERYNYYRPLYLKNLAREKLSQNGKQPHWQEALDWIDDVDSISNYEDSQLWNQYVDAAFTEPQKRINPAMVWRTLFAPPYTGFKLLYRKDNAFIADHLWEQEKRRWEQNKAISNWELLPKIKKPVLLIGGRFDAIATPEEIEEAHRLLANSELHILPNCGHQSFLSQPKMLNSLILQFLKLKS